MLSKRAPSPYSAAPAPGNPRQTEAWALIESARRMSLAQANPNTADMLAAVRLNWRLWTLLQASLVSPEAKLPDDLRANMLSLANFVDRHTVGVLADHDPKKLDVLIRINRELASGLIAPVPDAESASTADQNASAQASAPQPGQVNRKA
jgi:flagellar protein FlaF